MCYWSLDLIFKAKQKLESGNRKIQDGRQAAILKVTSLPIETVSPEGTFCDTVQIPSSVGDMELI